MKKETIVTILKLVRYLVGALIGWLSCLSAHAVGLLP